MSEYALWLIFWQALVSSSVTESDSLSDLSSCSPKHWAGPYVLCKSRFHTGHLTVQVCFHFCPNARAVRDSARAPTMHLPHNEPAQTSAAFTHSTNPEINCGHRQLSRTRAKGTVIQSQSIFFHMLHSRIFCRRGVRVGASVEYKSYMHVWARLFNMFLPCE